MKILVLPALCADIFGEKRKFTRLHALFIFANGAVDTGAAFEHLKQEQLLENLFHV